MPDGRAASNRATTVAPGYLERNSEMTRQPVRHRKALTPFGDMILEMEAMVRRLGDDDLERLCAACETTSQVNCAWFIYQAANTIMGRVGAERRRRWNKANSDE